MSDRTDLRQALAGLCFLFLVVATPVRAQQPTDEVTQSPDALNGTVAQIRSEIADYFRLESQLEEIEPGFREMLRSRIDERDLPDAMQSMSHDERVAYVEKLRAQRLRLQQQIREVQAERGAYIRGYVEDNDVDQSQSLGSALREAIRERADDRGITLEEDPAPAPRREEPERRPHR